MERTTPQIGSCTTVPMSGRRRLVTHGAIAAATVALLASSSAFAQDTCDSEIQPAIIPPATHWLVLPSPDQQSVTLRIRFGPSALSDTTEYNLVQARLECQAGDECGPLCNLAGSPAASFLGSGTIGNVIGCVDPGGNPVTIFTTNSAGDSSLVFSFRDAANNPTTVRRAPGQTCEFTIGVQIDDFSSEGASDQINAAVQASGLCDNGLNATACGSYLIRLRDPSIEIEKDADVAKICDGEDTLVNYSYLVTNTGDTPLENIVVTDDTCAPVVCDDNSLPIGGSTNCSCSTTINEATTNIAVATADAVLAGDNPASPFEVSDMDDYTIAANDPPDCDIDGPDKIDCNVSTEYCGPAGMASYSWEVTGDASIDGADDEECVWITADKVDGGSFTISLHIVDDAGCENDCELEVDVNCPLGACCIDPSTAECVDGLTAEECDDAEGTFFTGQFCDDEEVQEYCQPLGACCIDPATEECIDDVKEGECDDENGTFFPNKTCDDPEVVAFCSEADEGCTPGFWMQPHHCGHWPCSCDDDCDDDSNWGPYCPDSCGAGPTLGTLFTDVFNDTTNPSRFAGKTLDQALIPPGQMGFNPPQLRILTFHAIAALLNSETVNFAYTAQEVIDIWNNAIAAWEADGNVMHLTQAKNLLADANEEGCPLSGHADIAGPGGGAEFAQDGFVDGTDLMYVFNKWGTSDSRADINNDGIVDGRDLLEILLNWGPQTDHWKVIE
jgi:hypothetical protein